MPSTPEEAFQALNLVLKTNDLGNSLNDIQILLISGCWEGQTYSQIAEYAGYEPGYIKKVGSKLWRDLSKVFGTKVSKKNFKTTLKKYLQTNLVSESTNAVNSLERSAVETCQYWGEAINISAFWGRKEELATLEQWILIDRCSLITLLGIGGVGKTALSIKLAQHIQNQFSYVIWRSLKNIPPLMDLLADLLLCLSNRSLTKLPICPSERISLLIHYLQQHPCLIVLDNTESLLQSGKQFGCYHPNYSGYGELFNRVGEVAHLSCLILTSRELPEDVAMQTGAYLPVRVFNLPGLEFSDAQEILKIQGLSGSEAETTSLINSYRGNPLALKIAATSIQDIFSGNIAEFLQQGNTTFNGIRRLLEQQLERLSNLERQVMNWLAIYREPITVQQLADALVYLPTHALLLEALEFLSRRSLIEKVLPDQVERGSAGFTLQPVVMEYVTEQLISQISREIIESNLNQTHQFALILVQTKDYLREAQIRLILQPILNCLSASLQNSNLVEENLKRLLVLLRRQSKNQNTYAVGNIINLLRSCQFDFKNLDLSYLTIRQADLRGIKLHQVNLSHSNLETTIFSETLGSIFSLAFSPDGKFLAISSENEINLYHPPHYQKQFALIGHEILIWSIAFSEDGLLLASGSTDQTIKVWDINTGICLYTLRGHTGGVSSVVFCPQQEKEANAGYLLASASQDGSVKLWNVCAEKCLRTITDADKKARSVAFNPVGNQLAIGYFDGHVCILDLNSNQPLWLPSDVLSQESPMAFSPDHPMLAVGYSTGKIQLWDIPNQQYEKVLQDHSAQIFALSYSADGSLLASSSGDHTIRIWNPQTGLCLRPYL